MANVFDYLKWRGDLSFSDIRPNEIDAVMLAMVSYLDYESLCGGDIKTLRSAAEGYGADGDYESVDLGFIMPSGKINRMFCEMAASRRYGGLRISDFEARSSDEDVYQFGAVTFHMPGKQMMVVFRGTDDSLVGWREDCCLAFLDEIPAQRMAVEYLERIADKYPEERIYITGHSKGGNLAVYSAIKCRGDVKERIARAYCHDGPGLTRETVDSAAYRLMQRKLTVLLPQSSFVGTMFEKGKKYIVIKSSARGLLQHDPYSWELDGPAFLRLPELSHKGKKNEEQFRAGMERMSAEEKREFVDTMFSVLASTGAGTLSELTDGGLKKLITVVKTYGGLDKQKRELMLALVLKLFDMKRERPDG